LNRTTFLETIAEARAALKIEPQSVAFGHIPRDSQEQSKTVVITRGDGGPISPKIASTSCPSPLKAELREIEPGERYELNVTIGPPWPNGTLRGSLVVETGVSEAPQETIYVYASVPSRLAANPPRLMLRPDPQADTEVSTTLAWEGGPPGKVLEATSSDPRLQVSVEQRGDTQAIVLKVPAGYSGRRSGGDSVTITTDDPSVPTFRIPIYLVGTAVRPQGERAAAPSATGTQRRDAAQRPTRVPPTAPPEKVEQVAE